MKIIIRGVDNFADLVSAIASITNSALILGFFDQEEAHLQPEPTNRQSPQRKSWPRWSVSTSAARWSSLNCRCRTVPGRSPGRSSTCPALEWGQHERLADCWRCWCDHLVVEYGDPWGERR